MTAPNSIKRLATCGSLPMRIRLLAPAICCATALALLWPAQASGQQNPTIVACPSPGQDLLTIPEIQSKNGILKADVTLVDGMKTLWDSVPIKDPTTGKTRCASQDIRYFEGVDLNNPHPWPENSAPMPGPTLRARVGDLIEITFQNKINLQHFAYTLDQAELGRTNGCDEVFATPANWTAGKAYREGAVIRPTANNPGGFTFVATQTGRGTSGASAPPFPQIPGQAVSDNTVTWTNKQGSNQIYPTGGDYMPDCLHGSSSANLHFHGTHTTPSTTGDNVLLYVPPSLRKGDQIEPSDAFVKEQFGKIFQACEQSGPPAKWTDLPLAWRESQERLLKERDATFPYKGKPGTLPHSMQLWPSNAEEIAQGLWPQNQLGAYPYCFRLAKYNVATPPNQSPDLMGQAPGTHWYHAHKHGSTALNVANGMTGAFIIEGQYDDDLHKFYGPNLKEQVMVLQQISSTPFPVLSPARDQTPGAARPPISINGRRDPIVTMRPGEVQLWRIINGAFRDAVQFVSFTQQGAQQPCTQPGAEGPCVSWRQIAQDGVQFTFSNYERIGKPNNRFNLAPANRADLLVKAPTQDGTYVLEALANTGLPLQDCTGNPPPGCQTAADAAYSFPLLTVKVIGNPTNPPMDFIQAESDFPRFPEFLKDISEDETFVHRRLVFGAGNTTINGKRFSPNQISQAMLLNTAEEWTVMNQANDKAHPFHIHINPFQVTEVFEPNSKAATTKENPCYVDPNDPSTFKPCPSEQPQAPYVWWDTFGIPTGSQWNITSQCSDSNNVASCPKQLQPYTQCTGGTCTETIPGWFKMRSRFVDFPGQYVLHCHILIHEDRGMMQLIEVVPDKTMYTHH